MPRKKKTEASAPEFTQEDLNFAMQFAKAMVSNSYFNPMLMNQYLKNINMNPSFLDRDNVEKLVANPKDNEQALRRVSEHLYNVQMPYKRLVHYFADMLSFDISVYPINATDEDFKGKKFKSDYDSIWTWLESFDYKREFRKILIGMILEDAKFTYLRKSESGKMLQEMPTDFCMIDACSEFGWLYSFNLMYFQQTGVDINGFAPEFKKYYNNALDMKKNKTYYPNIKPENRNGQYMYWQQIDPDNGWVFKFHDNFAGLVPLYISLFVDAVDLDDYKTLQKRRTEIENYKTIMGTVPRNKDSKNGSNTDSFAIDAGTLAEFIKIVKAQLPDGVGFSALPLENLTSFDFNKSTTTSANITDDALNNFYSMAGADSAIFNSNKPNASTMSASLKIDKAFVDIVYSQFECFLNHHLNKQTKKYKFKVKLSGSIFTTQEDFDNQMKLLDKGIITPQLPASMHLTEKELRTGIGLMSSLNYPSMFTPVQTSSTLSSKDNPGGRPQQDKVEETGEITRDTGANDR